MLTFRAISELAEYLLLRNRIYYGLKPFIPHFLRTTVRRRLATRLRKRIGDVWLGANSAPNNLIVGARATGIFPAAANPAGRASGRNH